MRGKKRVQVRHSLTVALEEEVEEEEVDRLLRSQVEITRADVVMEVGGLCEMKATICDSMLCFTR